MIKILSHQLIRKYNNGRLALSCEIRKQKRIIPNNVNNRQEAQQRAEPAISIIF